MFASVYLSSNRIKIDICISYCSLYTRGLIGAVNRGVIDKLVIYNSSEKVT